MKPTREEVIRVARECGVGDSHGYIIKHELEHLERLAHHFYEAGATDALGAAAAVCDRFQARDVGMQPAECAGAIRNLIGRAK